jgi:Ser/Thr protein kinase RdoA (MazF antagonist)
LASAGFDGASKVVGSGYDDSGAETLEFIEGTFVHPHAWSDEGIFELGRLLRTFHDTAASFEPSDEAVWQDWFTRDNRPGAIIGHGDPGPWNIVARDGLPVALIDWEFAGPVDRIDEVAHAAWLNVQLHDDDVARLNGLPSNERRAAQLRLFLDGYGLALDDRIGFVGRVIEVAISSCAHEAVEGKITPDSSDPRWLWALAWRARSAAWMIRNRLLLEEALV